MVKFKIHMVIVGQLLHTKKDVSPEEMEKAAKEFFT